MLKHNIQKLLDKEGVEYEWSHTYSGRCMYGRVAEVAFIASLHPDTKLGRRILNRDFRVDNMGQDWVYYTFTSKAVANDKP